MNVFELRTCTYDGVVTYPVMQVYGSLALEDNSELVKQRWEDVAFPTSAPVPSSSKPKKQTYSLQWVLLGDNLVISPTCEERVAGLEGPIAKGTGMALDTSSWFLRPTLVP